MKIQLEKLAKEIKLIIKDDSATITDLINVIIDFINTIFRNEEF